MVIVDFHTSDTRGELVYRKHGMGNSVPSVADVLSAFATIIDLFFLFIPAGNLLLRVIRNVSYPQKTFRSRLK